MVLILFLTIDVACGCRNTGHNPYLECYHLYFVVTEHVFLCAEHEYSKKNPLLTLWSGMELEQEESIK